METITLPHLPDQPLQVCLFKDVKNAAFLRQQLLDGNAEFEYAFLDASAIVSRNHVLAACFRAINDQTHNRLKSRNVHSEIVFSLSPNNNIAESFRRFGIQDSATNILAIKVSRDGGDAESAESGDAEKVQSHLLQHVEGTPVEFSNEVLASMCDAARIKKIYKVDIADAKHHGSPEAARREAEAFVLGAMALKGS